MALDSDGESRTGPRALDNSEIKGENARPPASRNARQPHRRGRGGRAPGERGQGTRGKRAGRGRPAHRDHDRRRRTAADPGDRRRRRHDARRSGTRGRAPRHLQARRRRPAPDRHARVPRRGAAVDRLGGAVEHRHATCERTACLVHRGRRRREVRGEARGAVGGHARRGEGPVLCDAGAAEVPQERPQRGGGRARSRAAAGDEPARGSLHAHQRRAHGDVARGFARRAGKAGAARRHSRRGLPRQCGRGPCRARRRRGRRLCRTADAQPRQLARAISVRQRPAGARQAPDRRHSRRLCRLSLARPPSGAGAVRDAAAARGRRERASGQDRGAVPRRRRWCARC